MPHTPHLTIAQWLGIALISAIVTASLSTYVLIVGACLIGRFLLTVA